MPAQDIHCVTGAFGYSGKYISQRLLDDGKQVMTLTNSLHREHPFGDQIQAYPFNFTDPEALTNSLRGVSVLYNTYWVRFNHRTFTHAHAVANTQTLFNAAKAAGVQRVVHVSIANPAADSPYEYFRCKAQLEQDLIDTGLSHAILRPTVLFGKEDILINNIAWMLRHSPVFGVFGKGDYRIQPIHVDDLAALAVEQGASRDNVILDAVGVEQYAYRDMVKTIADSIGVRRPMVSVPAGLGYWAGWGMGKILRDVMLTRDEMAALMDGLLASDNPPPGNTRLSAWVNDQADSLGRQYASELARRRDRRQAY